MLQHFRLSKFFILAAYILLSAIVSGNQAIVSKDRSELISEKNKTLDKLMATCDQQLEFPELVKILVEIQPSGCPTIYSKVYCERLVIQGDLTAIYYEQKLRDFGRCVLEHIDNESIVANRNDISREERLRVIDYLLSFAEWIENGHGYGNAIIGGRLRAVAFQHIAFLSIDLSYPIEKGQKIYMRANSGGLLEWGKTLLKTLETEVGAPPIQGYQTATISADLYNDVAQREWEIFQKRKQEYASLKSGKLTLDTTDYAILRNSLPHAQAIFIQDDPRNFTNKTTTGMWDCYRVMPTCPYFPISEYISSTFIFRTEIGRFPLQPLPADTYINGRINPFYGSEINAAFYYAWKEFSLQEKNRSSNHYRNPKNGRVEIRKNEKTLAEKYLDIHADVGASAIYRRAKESNVGALLGADSPKNIREGRSNSNAKR